MDAPRFDDLAKRCALRLSRRRALGGALGAALLAPLLPPARGARPAARQSATPAPLPSPPPVSLHSARFVQTVGDLTLAATVAWDASTVRVVLELTDGSRIADLESLHAFARDAVAGYLQRADEAEARLAAIAAQIGRPEVPVGGNTIGGGPFPVAWAAPYYDFAEAKAALVARRDELAQRWAAYQRGEVPAADAAAAAAKMAARAGEAFAAVLLMRAWGEMALLIDRYNAAHGPLAQAYQAAAAAAEERYEQSGDAGRYVGELCALRGDYVPQERAAFEQARTDYGALMAELASEFGALLEDLGRLRRSVGNDESRTSDVDYSAGNIHFFVDRFVGDGKFYPSEIWYEFHSPGECAGGPPPGPSGWSGPYRTAEESLFDATPWLGPLREPATADGEAVAGGEARLLEAALVAGDEANEPPKPLSGTEASVDFAMPAEVFNACEDGQLQVLARDSHGQQVRFSFPVPVARDEEAAGGPAALQEGPCACQMVVHRHRPNYYCDEIQRADDLEAEPYGFYRPAGQPAQSLLFHARTTLSGPACPIPATQLDRSGQFLDPGVEPKFEWTLDPALEAVTFDDGGARITAVPVELRAGRRRSERRSGQATIAVDHRALARHSKGAMTFTLTATAVVAYPVGAEPCEAGSATCSGTRRFTVYPCGKERTQEDAERCRQLTAGAKPVAAPLLAPARIARDLPGVVDRGTDRALKLAVWLEAFFVSDGTSGPPSLDKLPSAQVLDVVSAAQIWAREMQARKMDWLMISATTPAIVGGIVGKMIKSFFNMVKGDDDLPIGFGLIPRAIEELFDSISDLGAIKDWGDFVQRLSVWSRPHREALCKTVAQVRAAPDLPEIAALEAMGRELDEALVGMQWRIGNLEIARAAADRLGCVACPIEGPAPGDQESLLRQIDEARAQVNAGLEQLRALAAPLRELANELLGASPKSTARCTGFNRPAASVGPVPPDR